MRVINLISEWDYWKWWTSKLCTPELIIKLISVLSNRYWY